MAKLKPGKNFQLFTKSKIICLCQWNMKKTKVNLFEVIQHKLFVFIQNNREQ